MFSMDLEKPQERIIKRDFGFLPIPRRLRHCETAPVPFTLGINLLLFFVSVVTFASLTICVPILITLSHDLHVDYLLASKLPSFAILGCLPGILFICPLGDTSRRRPIFILFLLAGSLCMMGAALSRSFAAFAVFTAFAGFTSVPFQMAIPWTGDLAGDNRKALAISISELLTGYTRNALS
jgi:MFS family permease